MRWPDFGLWRDLAGESLEAVAGRRMRSLLTMAGVMLGIVALVATLGIAATAAAQISGQFDALKATQVGVVGFNDGEKISASALDRVRRLNGVISAGFTAEHKGDLPEVSRANAKVPSAAVASQVIAASPEALDALRIEALSGRTFDLGHDERHDQVVLLGEVAAQTLGITEADGNTMVYVSGRPHLVLGIVTSRLLDSPVPLSVIVPGWTAASNPTGYGAPQVAIRVRPGAAQQVGAEARLALDPVNPVRLLAQVPSDPKRLAANVKSATSALFLLLAMVSLLVGAIGIGNTTLVSVLERRSEIGLRRAIGASRPAVLTQFLIESGLIGLAGGVVGTMAGLNVTVGVAFSHGWTAAIPPWLLAAGPVLGLAVGLIAGVYPAFKAARIEPVSALSG
ncbi:ABC transporter permease [Actinocorallia lasiicapitis]